MEFPILELADISNAFTIAFPLICICTSFFPIQVRSHNHQSNCSSSYTPHSASFSFHHHSCCQTPILVKCNCLCSLYLWLTSSRWRKAQSHAAVPGHYPATPQFPQPVPPPTLQDHFLHHLFSTLQLSFPPKHTGAFSSHCINKRELSRIDSPPFFTTKIYKTIHIYTGALYLLY